MEPDAELELLKDAVEQTKALYERAKLEHKRQTQQMHDLGIAHSDGSKRHATKVYMSALNAYQTALRRYNRYVLDKTGPTVAAMIPTPGENSSTQN